MGIRTKIMMGFIILASMLFISGAISIFELTKLGKAVKGLIFDNYRSIDYSRNMLDALENQESALLLFANGDTISAKEGIRQAQFLFKANLDSAIHNFTLDDERMLIDSVSHSSTLLQKKVDAFLSSNNSSLSNYLNEVGPYIAATSNHVKNLITINQDALYDSATYLENSAQRASMPGLIVIITSLIFTFVFTYLVHHYFVSPIIRLTKGINDFVKYRKPFEVSLETKDELLSLKESITSLTSLVKTLAKKNE